MDSQAGLKHSPFLTLQEVTTLSKHVSPLSALINFPSAYEIVAIIPYFGRSLGDTGDIAASQSVDKVAGAALPTEACENLPFRRS
jgi:hypothetical protein